ncbi:cytosolic phospholipase A2 gamma-like [Salminus brasiliensis]|uniref:cytosolic phospholipase A2 gamma-like n=1 Tax=Salminus brasiliensis TaxID=930266 RepID=UPI003B8308F6
MPTSHSMLEDLRWKWSSATGTWVCTNNLTWKLLCCRQESSTLMKAALKSVGVTLPTTMDIYTSRCRKRATCIMKDPTHPAHSLFVPLPSDRRLWSIKCSRKVRVGHSLNKAERQHVVRRKEKILHRLRQHNISCNGDTVPNIAVLGSGGGLRAMVGLLGSLSQLNKEGLLDCIMYLSGVSGSTWCMASLYKEPDWSTKLETVKHSIATRLSEGNVSCSEKCNKLVKYYSTKDNFSLTDVYAALAISSLVNEIDERSLTEQRGKFTNDPYPIYTVIDKQSKFDRLKTDPWFEITPDESGHSLTGVFVDSSCLGSQFENGKRIKDQPEMDILYLQGLCGSAISESEQILQSLLKLIQDSIENSIENENSIARLKPSTRSEMSISKAEVRRSTLEICNSFFDLFGGRHSWDNVWITIVTSIKLTVGWIWGTTYNYLNKMKVDGVHPSILSSEKRNYEDAGLLNNSPYFSVLRKNRNIDLIISLDFSEGNPFMTVVQTAEKCKELGIPFPEVVVPAGEILEPEDFYVFRGYKAPTVIHIPLFNRINCKGEIKKWKETYKTFQGPYSASMITDLLEKAGLNIKNNKEKLLKEIKYVTEQKKISKLE